MDNDPSENNLSFETLFNSNDDKILFDGWVKAARRVRPVLFVGAGLSLNAVPSPGWRNRSRGRQEPPRCLSWKALIEILKKGLREDERKESDYLRIAQYFSELHGLQQLHLEIQDAVPDHDLLPGAPHYSLTQINWEAILTTNYDTLIEKAYESSGERGQVHMVYRDQDLARPRLPGAACELLHLHGVLDDASSLVLTAEDYRRYVETHPGMITRVRQLFVQHPVLILGFSLDDPNFYALNGWVRDLLQGTGRPPVLCVQHEPTSEARRSRWRAQGIQVATLKIPEDKARRPVFDALDKLYASLLDCTFSLIGAESADGLTRDWLRDPELLREHARKEIIEQVDICQALSALERILAGLPRTLIDNQERHSVWETFAERVVSAHDKELWAKLGHSTQIEAGLEVSTAQETRGAIHKDLSGDALNAVMSCLSDAQVAAKWLYLGIVHIGPQVPIASPRVNYDLVEAMRSRGLDNKLGASEHVRIKLARCRAAYDTGNAGEAEQLALEIRESHPSVDVLDELIRIRRLYIFRADGVPPSLDGVREEELSVASLNVQGAHALWFGDAETALRVYGLSVTKARRDHDRVAEWAALQGLMHAKSFDYSEATSSQLSQEQVRRVQFLRRLDKLREDRDVEYLDDRLSNMKARAREQLLEGVEAELREWVLFPYGGSTRIGDFSHLWSALLKQEELGLPPDFCRETAELIGAFAFRQGSNLPGAISLLVRYGATKSLKNLFELYPPSKYASPEDVRKIFGGLLSPGRAPGEWLTKLEIMKFVLRAFSDAELKRFREFLEQLGGSLPARHLMAGERVGTFGGQAIWSILDDVVALGFAVSSYFEDATEWILKFVDSDDGRVRRASVERLDRVSWDELVKLRRIDFDRLFRALQRVLEKDVGDQQLLDFRYSRGLFGGVLGLIEAVGEQRPSAYPVLAAALERMAERWIVLVSGSDTQLSVAEYVLKCLELIGSVTSKARVQELLSMSVARIRANDDGARIVREVRLLVGFFEQLQSDDVRAVLQRALEVVDERRLSADGGEQLAYFAARALLCVGGNYHEQARDVLAAVLRRQSLAVRVAVIVPRAQLGKVAEQLEGQIAALLKGLAPVAARTTMLSPWRRFHNEEGTPDARWYRALSSGVLAARSYAISNGVLPGDWAQSIEAAARHPNRNLAATALGAIGKILAALKLPDYRDEWLTLLAEGLADSEIRIWPTAAYWLGVLSDPETAPETAAQAQSIIDGIPRDAQAGLRHYATLGRASASTESGREFHWR